MNRAIVSLLALAAFLGALAWMPGSVAADPNGTILGTVSNGTPGGAAVAGQQVTLISYDSVQEVSRATTTTDAQGRFQFSGVSADQNYIFSLLVNYQGAEYRAEPKHFDKGSSTLNWDFTVYEGTPTPDKISINRGHLIVDMQDNVMSVLEFFSFANSGDKAYVGSRVITDDGRKETIRLALPIGADDVSSDQGLDECCAFLTDSGLSDTLPVEPGGRDVVISYQLPYKESTVYLDLPVYFPVENMNLLVADKGAKISSPQLKPQGPVNMGGQKYLSFVGQGLSSDSELSIDFTDLPQKNAVNNVVSPSNIRWGGIGAAVLVIGFVIVYAVTRRPRASAPAESASREPRASRKPAGQDVLLREMAELDDKFASGQIDEAKYERLRDEKKRQLKELMAEEETED